MPTAPKINPNYPISRELEEKVKYGNAVVSEVIFPPYDFTGKKKIPLYKALFNTITFYRAGNEMAVHKGLRPNPFSLPSDLKPSDFKALTPRRKRMLWLADHDQPVDWRDW